VHKSGAKFDPEKTKWFQHHYLQLQEDESLAKEFQIILEKKGISASLEYVTGIIGLLKERAVFIEDFWEMGSYFFQAPEGFEEKAAKKVWKEDSPELINKLTEIISNTEPYNAETLQNSIKGWITANSIGFGKVMQPFRLSLVGAMQGPVVFEIAARIGKEETINRLKFAKTTL